MSFLTYLIPLLAAVQSPQMIEETYDPEDQIVIYDDPAEIFEIEFNEDEEEEFLETE